MVNKYVYEGLPELSSVSAGDSTDTGIMITDQTLILDGMENIFSVSSGDGNMQPNIYVMSLPQDAGTDVSADAFSAGEAYTVWNKPLEEYSVSEGLLLIIVTLAVVAFIWGVVKGGFSWLGW